jgi:hypothetical protein
MCSALLERYNSFNYICLLAFTWQMSLCDAITCTGVWQHQDAVRNRMETEKLKFSVKIFHYIGVNIQVRHTFWVKHECRKPPKMFAINRIVNNIWNDRGHVHQYDTPKNTACVEAVTYVPRICVRYYQHTIIPFCRIVWKMWNCSRTKFQFSNPFNKDEFLLQ